MILYKINPLKKAVILCMFFILLTGNMVIISNNAKGPATEQLIEDNEEDGGGSGLTVFANSDLAQCFYASGTYELTRVSLYVMDEVPIDNPLTVAIHDNDDFGTPGDPYDDIPGPQIGSVPAVNCPDNVFVWVDFDFSGSPVPLSDGIRYWIVARCGGGDGQGYRWKDSDADMYPGGYLAEDGPAWSIDNSNDLMFRVFGEVVNDVGVEDMIMPKHGEIYREIDATAVVKNYGENNQGSFDAICVITDPFGSEVLNDTKNVAFLDSGDAVDLTWFFVPMMEGIYAVTVVTLLPGDEYDTNNITSMDMKVRAMAILKLHHEVSINGYYADWYGDGLLTDDTWHTSRREYIWKDAVGDDNGDGDYMYPSEPTGDNSGDRFEPGCLDLRQFRVAIDENSINFLLSFGSIDDGSGDGTDGPLGFSEQVIEILIDVDGDGTGRDDTIRNARLKLGSELGWEFALWADGWGNGYVEDENGNIYDVVSAAGSPLTNSVEISLPATAGQAIPDFKMWRYFVMVGAQDNESLPDPIHGSSSGFMKVDELPSAKGGGGGQDSNGADPNVYDLAFASPQASQLDNYGNEDIMFASFSDVLGADGGNIDSTEVWAQSFTVPFTSLLSSVDIYAKDIGIDSPRLYIMIQTNDDKNTADPTDDTPSGTTISSAEAADFATSYEWQGVSFSNPPLLRRGETYWIIAVSGDSGGNGYQWGKQPGDPWPEGASAVNILGTWFQQPDDMLFNASLRELSTVHAYQPIYFAPMVISDVYANGSADEEWVSLYYNGTVNAPNLEMDNWTLSDQDGNDFLFKDYKLTNKKNVTVHCGSGTNTSKDLFWNRTEEVWNDLGDDVLLKSSFTLPGQVPLDYMNYTDGNVFGNSPPKWLNWDSESGEIIPRNPENLQVLTLRVYGKDNDFFSDWELEAVGNIEVKTLYLYDDGTYTEQDPYDFMNTTPPTLKTVPDFDNDGQPGLTLIRSGPPSDPRRYQEFNLTPVLAKDFIIADDIIFDLWLDDNGKSSWETINLGLYDCNETTNTEIAIETKTFLSDELKDWELVTVTIPDVVYTLQKGHYLMLRLDADNSCSEDLWLAYNTTDQASCIKTLPTRTFVNVDWAKTYSVGEVEKSNFLLGENVIIKANVSDPFGSYDIVGANISVIPPGGPEPAFEKAMLLNSTDPNDPSAWKLFNFTYTGTDTPGKYTVRIKGIESNGVTHTISIFFNVLNNAPPQLKDASLLPNMGSAADYFNFTVNYTDVDNDPPDTIMVNITGLGKFDLMAFDSSDTDYKDGKIYYINITGFVNGTSYSYHFAANDSKGLWNETMEFSGPEILNTPPVLTDPNLNPGVGNASTPFNFTINYTDSDNHPPNMISVNITGPSHSGSWIMVEADPSDTDYADGKIYYYNYSGFYNGSYNYHFAANDSRGEWNESIGLQFDVMNTGPILISAQLMPGSGYITTEFNYTVTYIDLDDQAPINITVNITGPSHSGSWVMAEVDPLDTLYTDGKEYYYTYTGLIIGTYSFHCAANDSQGTWNETIEISDPDVFNTRPTLTNHNLDPAVGTAGSTIFNYTITYTDLDNQSPGNITVNITGPSTGNFTMIDVDPSDTNYRDGKDYYFNTTLPIDGNYAYRIDANDTDDLWAVPIFDSGPNVGSAAPVLSQPWVTPLIGITTTWFNFTINYTDLQNDSAGTITLNLTGTTGGTYSMQEADPSDTNTTDGKFFYYNLTGLAKGIYIFNVEGNDSLGNPAESAFRFFPWVLNSLPILSGGYINESKYGGSWFNFSLSYIDIDNDSAGNVNVNISGLGNFTMIELDPMDSNWTDGKEFYLNISIPKGSYLYRFEVNDTGFGHKWNYTAIEELVLLNNIPFFTEQKVMPPTGFGGDYFNFTINGSDYDNDILSPMLSIVGEPGSPFTMIELDVLDMITSDGKLYFYNLSLVKGTYSYHFQLYDGDELNETTPNLLIVSNNPPVITTLDIGDTLEDDLYSVDYDYIDLDGDAITWSLETNASWLDIDSDTGLLSGTPSNLEVGGYYVNVTLDDGDGGLDSHNYTLNVTNTPPLITTMQDEFAEEDFLHLNDFACVDDGQGDIVYYLVSNASWLDIDPDTGLLSGTPDNTRVGWFWVNVSVSDGNGGIDSKNYTLTVNNTLPSLSTIPDDEAVEDSLHLDDFNCDDDNQGNISYSINSNASWLTLSPITGILSGTPDNTHVGWFWVNVTVDDGHGGKDSINYTLSVLNTPPQLTTFPDNSTMEDSLHSDDFDCDDDNQGNIIYSFLTNASWLAINSSTGVLSGTPNNTHIGWYWVNVTVEDGNGGNDTINYTVTVVNNPPTITTSPDDTATEDTLHSDDLDCDDDGQGNITYSLFTNATWLDINSSTGVLSGTPDNSDLGSYWVNVSVSDGNGGTDSVNYTLTVSDVNDPPEITTPNLEIVDEDELYSVDYEFIDVDDYVVIWALATNSSWLAIDPNSGLLWGTPTNLHVGGYYVNVTVDDGRGGFNHTNFTLIVNNTPPSITNLQPEFVEEDELYWEDFNCTDDSQGSILYSLLTNATWLSIDPFTGVLSGTPNNTHVGRYWVNVTVSDGNGGFASVNYTLTVNNSIPSITTITVPNAYEDSLYTEDFNCTDDDQGLIIYHLTTNASWLSIDNITGIVSGTPVNEDVGSYWINVTVEDGNGGNQSINYTLMIINTNDAPVIVTNNLEDVDEDSSYWVDYGYTDDDSDSVGWDLITEATWPSINPNTGVLSGIPENDDVGSFWVNVTVDDGNGGYDYTNFTLVVTNTNDQPSTPQLLLPADDSTVNTTHPTFMWSESIDPDIGDFITNYTLQYSTTSDFSGDVITITGVSNTSFIPITSLQDKTGYYWRVEAFDSHGIGSGFQTTHFVFSVNTGYFSPSYIGGIKSGTVKYGDVWFIDLDDYFHLGYITEDLSFTSNYEEIDIDPDTHVASWTPKNSSSTLTDVIFTLSDGRTNASSFPIDLTVEKEVASLSFWERIFWPWISFPFIFLALFAGAFYIKKRRERPVIEEVFFISENGRLIAHSSVRAEEEIDEDILGGMLTGVKDLISEAFVGEGEGREDKGLHKLEFGEKSILLEKGNHFFIALVFSGKGLVPKLKEVVDEIEERYGDVLEDWDGNMSAFKGADEIIEELLSLGKFTEEQKEKIKEGKMEDKILEKWSSTGAEMDQTPSPTTDDESFDEE